MTYAYLILGLEKIGVVIIMSNSRYSKPEKKSRCGVFKSFFRIQPAVVESRDKKRNCT